MGFVLDEGEGFDERLNRGVVALFELNLASNRVFSREAIQCLKRRTNNC